MEYVYKIEEITEDADWEFNRVYDVMFYPMVRFKHKMMDMDFETEDESEITKVSQHEIIMWMKAINYVVPKSYYFHDDGQWRLSWQDYFEDHYRDILGKYINTRRFKMCRSGYHFNKTENQ